MLESLVVGVGGVGSIISNTTVASGATLKGSGTITGSVTRDDGGVITPGNSIGTMSIVNGPLVLNSTSTTNGALAGISASPPINISGRTTNSPTSR